MNMVNVARIRGETLRQIYDAIRSKEPQTFERQEAVIEALCLAAATVFITQSQIPYDRSVIEGCTQAAIGGMVDWLEKIRDRN